MKTKLIFTTFIFFLITSTFYGQSIIKSQSFDSGASGYSDDLTYTTSGNTTITNASSESAPNSFKLNSNNSNITFQNVDISSFSNVTATVSFSSVNANNNKNLFLYVSYDNGTSWNTTKLIDGQDGAGGETWSWGTPDNDGGAVTSNPYTFSIPDTENSIKLRLRTNKADNARYFYVDNIVVKGTASTPCTEPTAQASNLTFSAVTDTSIVGDFTAASPTPDNYLVLMNTTGTPPSLAPADTNSYAIGDTIGGTTVIDTDANTTFTATALSPTTTYYFYIYSFNTACGGGPDYYTTAPLSSNETTIAGPLIVPATGTNTYSVCSGNLYDSGGSTGDYVNNSSGYTVLNPNILGNYMQVSGSITTEGGFDYLTIYDGVGTAGTVLWGGSPHGSGTSCSTFTIPLTTSITGSLTVEFYSDGSKNCSGFDLTINCTTTPGTVSYCESTSWDPDGLYINSLAFVGTLADPPANTSTYNATGYQDHTGLSPIAIQAQGEGVNIVANAYGNTFYRGTWKAWVDWNKDGAFNNTNELVYDIYGFAGSNITFGFEVPATATAGNYTMRIKVNNGYDSWYGLETYGFDFNACDDFEEYASYDFWIEDYGETEDYLFTVIESCDANIATITDGESCGTGTVDLYATGTTGVTGFNIYTTETGGTALSPAPTFTAPGGVPTASWTSPSLATTTTYWITATNGSCESLVRTPIEAKISPTPTVTFTPANPVICGEDTIQITAGGDFEIKYLINEDFETGSLGDFNNVNNDTTPAAVKANTSWKNKTSVYLPATNPDSNVWYPAVSSGFGPNQFAIANSDSPSPNYPTSFVQNALTLSSAVNSTDFINLTLELDFYYSRYFSDGLYPTDEYAVIEISTNGGTTYTPITPAFTADIGIGTRFTTLSYDLTAYINETNLKIRVRQYADADSVSGWTPGGIAVDNIKFFGKKPLNTAFDFDTSTVNAFTDAAATISYTPNTPATTIWIKPSLAQLENSSFTIPVNTILSNGCTVSSSIVVTNNTKVFKGGGTDWSDPTNWKPEGVPTPDNCVVIPDGEACKVPNNISIPFPPFDYQAYAKNLTVHSAGGLEILTDNYLTVTDWVNVKAGGDLTIKSGGSLIQVTDVASNNNSGNITMERTATINSPYDYIYWASPVEGFNITNVSPGSSNIYEWIPTISGNYGDWSATTENMIPGKGYIIRNVTGTPTPSTPEFVGTPNNGIITKAITRGTYNGADYPGGGSTMATKLDDNWNLIGNPYPSAISADTFISTNAGVIDDDVNNSIQGTVYLWRHIETPSNAVNDPFYQGYVYNYNPNDYVAYNSTGSNPSGFDGKIASGQAFFVLMEHTAPVNSNVIFNNTMRGETLNNSQFYRTEETQQRTSEIEKHRIWLDLITPSNTANSILVGYIEGATNSKDRLYDAYELSETSARFYSLIENEKMAIQGKALPFQDADTVPLGIEISQSGNYTIAINSLDGLFETTNQSIFIEDTYTNTFHNLRINPYSFNINAGTYNDRFILRYTDHSLSTTDYDLNALEILAPNNNYIKVISGNSTIESVTVYDLLGRALRNHQNINAKEFIINDNKFSEGAYIVKVTLVNQKQKTQKVILKH